MSDCAGYVRMTRTDEVPPNPDHAIGPTKLVKRPPAAAIYLLTDMLDQIDNALARGHYNEDETRGLLRAYRCLAMELSGLEAVEPGEEEP